MVVLVQKAHAAREAFWGPKVLKGLKWSSVLILVGMATVADAQSEAERLRYQLVTQQIATRNAADEAAREQAAKTELERRLVDSQNAVSQSLTKQTATIKTVVVHSHETSVKLSEQLADATTKMEVKAKELQVASGQAAASATATAQATTRTQALMKTVREQQQLGIALLGALSALFGWLMRRIHKNVLKIEVSINSRMDELLATTRAAALGKGALDERARHEGDTPTESQESEQRDREAAVRAAQEERAPFLPHYKLKKSK